MLKRAYDRNRFIINGVFVALLVILLITGSSQTRSRDFTFSEIDYNVINDSVPWPVYKKMIDSMRLRKSWENYKLRSSGDGWSVLSFGFSKIQQNDTCCNFFSGDEKNIGYFLQLPNFEIKPGAHVLIDSNKYFIEYVADDSKDVSTLLRKELKNVRYAYGYNEIGSLLIPLNHPELVKIVLASIAIVLGIVGVIVFIVMPIRLLYRISNGIIFTRQNIKTMNWFGWGLVGLVLLTPLLSKVTEWVLGDRIPDAIHFPFWEYILSHKFSLISGLIVLVFANAFKKGYSLQQDQDLTI